MIRFLSAMTILASISACNTVEGIGRDLSAGGAAISGVSNEVRRELPPPPPAPQPTYIY